MKKPRRLWGRVLAGFTLALAIALSAWFVIDSGSVTVFTFGSFWFLAFLPAYLCALICYIGDPDCTRPASFYLSTPLILCGTIVVGSVYFLHEGVVCLVMLSPLWIVFGWLGAFLIRSRRRWKRPADSNTLYATFLFLPLLSGSIENQLPFPHDRVTLTRETVIHATPEEIWPYAVASAAIRNDEGRWNFTQNILGIPRPRAATIDGIGKGALRTAWWGKDIHFDEKITQWQPGRLLGWSFSFTNNSLRDYTDKHISPDGPFLKIDTGGYTLTPLTPDTTLLTLRTNYIAKTHFNLYAEMWGEIFLGDIENNILAVIRQRAENRHGQNPTQHP